MAINGTSGNDTLTGTSGDDFFNVYQGGDDTVSGLAGNDIFNYGAALTAADTINGGGGDDTVEIKGDYSAGLVLGATTLTGVEQLKLSDGFNYNITENDANVASGASLTINALTLSGGNRLIFDGSAETNGSIRVVGGTGDDVVNMGAALTAADRIDGTSGNDTVNVSGDYSFGFTNATLRNIDTFVLGGGHNYHFVTNDTNVAAFTTMTVDASGLESGDTLIFSGTHETDGFFNFIGGAGLTEITGGSKSDVLNMGANLQASDRLNGNGSSDTLNLAGNYTLVMEHATLTSIETMHLAGGFDYDLTTGGGILTGALMTVDATALGAGDSLRFDAHKETAGRVTIDTGAGPATLIGGTGNDLFNFDSVTQTTFGTNSAVDGQAGTDKIVLNGEYTGAAAIVLTGTQIQNVETISLTAGHDYSLTLSSTTVKAGASMTVDAGTLAATNTLTLDGSHANSTAVLDAIGGAGNDAITGGAAADIIDLSKGGEDTAHGGSGNDTITMGGTLSAGDVLDGGAGNDTVNLTGRYSQTFAATNFTSVETLKLGAGHVYSFTTVDGNVAAGATLTVDASALGASDTDTFNGAAETDGTFHFTGGAGNDTDTSGALGAVFDFTAGGNDKGTGGASGASTFIMGATLNASDTLNGGAGGGIVQLAGDYTGANALTATTNLTHIPEIDLAAGNSYSIVLSAATVSGVSAFTLNAGTLGASDSVSFDGSAATTTPMTLTGGAGNDTLTSGSGAASFDLSHGGDDTATGGALGDTFTMGATLGTNDALNGGAGSDTVVLSGAYNLALSATNFTSIETLRLAAGSNYILSSNDANVAAGATLTVDGGALAAANSLTFNGAAESDGHFAFIGGAGSDTLTGGALSNTFDLSAGGSDTATGGAGNDTFTMGAALSSGDVLTGGGGSDTVILSGTYSQTLAAGNFSGIGTLRLSAGSNYTLTTVDANVASGATLIVDASALAAANAITFNGAAETNGHFAFIGGAGNDTLTAGTLSATFDLSGGGEDTATGGAGSDIFTMGAALSSGDVLNGGGGNDTVILSGAYSQTLAAANFASIETLRVAAGSNYALTTVDANVASGATLTVDASALAAADSFTFNGAAETNGHFAFIGGAGNDTLTSGTLGATFDLTEGGSDTATGGASGASTFNMGATLDGTDRLDGGAGGGTVNLDGTYAGLSLSATVLKHIGAINLTGGFAYNLTWTGATGPATAFTLDGTAASVLSADFSAITSGAGDTILGSAGNDTILGAHGGTIDVTQGGHDTVNAEGGTILAGAAFDSADAFSNVGLLTLNGAYSGFTISSTMVTGTAGELLLTGGHAYGITDGAAAQFSEIVENNAGGSFTFSGTAETTNPFTIDILAGSGESISTGGGDDVVTDPGTNLTFNGHGGNDSLTMSGAFGSSVFNGGSGDDDELHILDVDSIVATSTNLIGIDVVTFAQNGSFTLAASTIATGGSFLVQETGSGSLTANASADTDTTGLFSFDNENTTGGNTAVGSAGADFLIASGNNNTFTGGAGGDNIFFQTGSTGNTVIINAVSESTSVNFDSTLGFNYTNDHFKISGIGPTAKPVAIDPFFNTGSLTHANFDANLAADVSAGRLAGHHAVLFTPSSGDFGSATFLIVDENGTPGYQASADLVIEVDGSGFTGLTTATFT